MEGFLTPIRILKQRDWSGRDGTHTLRLAKIQQGISNTGTSGILFTVARNKDALSSVCRRRLSFLVQQGGERATARLFVRSPKQLKEWVGCSRWLFYDDGQISSTKLVCARAQVREHSKEKLCKRYAPSCFANSDRAACMIDGECQIGGLCGGLCASHNVDLTQINEYATGGDLISSGCFDLDGAIDCSTCGAISTSSSKF